MIFFINADLAQKGGLWLARAISSGSKWFEGQKVIQVPHQETRSTIRAITIFLDFWRIEVKKNHANIILLCSRVDIRRKINHYAPLNEKMHTTESFRKEFHIQVISVHTLSHVTEST